MLVNSTSYGLAHTTTFRRASFAMFKQKGIRPKGYGSNLQNPSPRMMEIYKPLDGNIFLQPDQAGAEALVVAYLAPHKRFRDLFLNNIKSHTYVASHIFRNKWIKDGYTSIDSINNMEAKKLSQDIEWKRLALNIKFNCEMEYFVGKMCCHAFNYRMRPSTFQENVLDKSEGELVLSKQESELYHATYHRIFPEISQGWWPELEYQVIKTGYLYNLFGFPLYCNYYEGMTNRDKFWRETTARVPQSTVGCLTAIAFCEIQDYIDEHKLGKEWHLRNDKHDSLLLECPERHKDDAIPILRKSIERELVSPRGEHFCMKSEIACGKCWAKYNEKTCQDGMKDL